MHRIKDKNSLRVLIANLKYSEFERQVIARTTKIELSNRIVELSDPSLFTTAAGITKQVDAIVAEGNSIGLINYGVVIDGIFIINSLAIEIANPQEAIRSNLIKEFSEVINRNNLEAGSDTPDFILAEYLVDCIDNFNKTHNRAKEFAPNPLLCETRSSIRFDQKSKQW